MLTYLCSESTGVDGYAKGLHGAKRVRWSQFDYNRSDTISILRVNVEGNARAAQNLLIAIANFLVAMVCSFYVYIEAFFFFNLICAIYYCTM